MLELTLEKMSEFRRLLHDEHGMMNMGVVEAACQHMFDLMLKLQI
jgi:hypothetical protein